MSSIVDGADLFSAINYLAESIRNLRDGADLADMATAAAGLAAFSQSHLVQSFGTASNVFALTLAASDYYHALESGSTDQLIVASLGLIEGLGGFLASVPGPGQAAGLALALTAKAARMHYENREPIGDALQSIATSIENLVVEVSDSNALNLSYNEIKNAEFNINGLFDAARGQVIIQRRDPVVLDLDGDGIETVGTSAGVMFDHDGDDVKNASGWVKGDDAFVVLDRNGNGRIDNGGELFGDHTVLASGKKAANGFEALAELDENKYGVFNATDARFAEVKLWRDLNQNGVSDAGELKSFAESGVLSIDLKGVTKDGQTLAGGNVLAQRTTYTRSNGTTGLTGTVDAAAKADATITEGSGGALDLTSDPFYREFTDPVAVTESGLGYGYLFKFKPIATAIAIT